MCSSPTVTGMNFCVCYTCTIGSVASVIMPFGTSLTYVSTCHWRGSQNLIVNIYSKMVGKNAVLLMTAIRTYVDGTDHFTWGNNNKYSKIIRGGV